MGNAIHLEFKGELTIFSAQERRAELLRALAALESGETLVVDLAQVSEMDCAGVQLLLAARKEAQARGLSLAFVEPGPAVQDTLELCDLSGLLVSAAVPAQP